MSGLIARTPMVGRARELASVRRHLQAAQEGSGSVLLLAGEAGIGKSRLVSEAEAQALRSGFQILRGACFEPDRALPFGPISDLLRAFLQGRTPSEIIDLCGDAATELVKLLPELAGRLPGLPPAPQLDPEHERHRFTQTVTRFLLGLADTQPLLLIVEDLHWSDDSSLDFLLNYARRVAARPIVLILTYRSDEMGEMLGHRVAELERERLAAELPLSRLPLADVEAMLQAIFAQAQPIRREFLEAIYPLTAGNPFFIEEVLKALVSVGDIFQVNGVWDRRPMSELRIPRTVQDAVRRRTQQLSAGARRVLAFAAVAGQRFDFQLLQELTGCSEPELLELIKELLAAQLVVEETADRFSFRHALTRQAVEAELLARERRALHHAIAMALERQHGDSLEMALSDLARHYSGAEVWEQALEYSRRAGEQAQAMYAPRAAVEHFTRALEAAQALSLAAPSGLYRARGAAHEMLGDFEHARTDLEAALEMARSAGDSRAEWQALADLGFLWAARDYDRSATYHERALTLAQELEEPSIIARSLNRVGNCRLMGGRPPDACPYHERALSMFEALDDQAGIAETLDLLGLATMHSGDTTRGAECYTRAAALYRGLDDRRGLITSIVMLSAVSSTFVLMPMVPIPRSLAVTASEAHQAVATAREIGWQAGEAFALAQVGQCTAARGEYAAALAQIGAGLRLAEEIEHQQWSTAAHVCLGMCYFDLCALAAARHHLERALSLAQETRSGYWMAWVAAPLARTCVLQGDLDRALMVLEMIPDSDAPVQSSLETMCRQARAALLLARGDPAAALALTDDLVAATARARADAIVPSLWLLRGECLGALGRMVEAEATLREALTELEQLDALPLLWRVHAALARLCQAHSRPDDAEREAIVARTIIERLADSVPEEPADEHTHETLRSQFVQAALATLPRLRPPTMLRAEQQAHGGLTARERDVAVLVARGCSNREIAETLVVSERTVEYHMSNILAKLGSASRAQVAVWAVAHGLTGDPTTLPGAARNP